MTKSCKARSINVTKVYPIIETKRGINDFATSGMGLTVAEGITLAKHILDVANSGNHSRIDITAYRHTKRITILGSKRNI